MSHIGTYIRGYNQAWCLYGVASSTYVYTRVFVAANCNEKVLKSYTDRNVLLTLSLIALHICYTSLTANLRRNSTTFTNFWEIIHETKGYPSMFIVCKLVCYSRCNRFNRQLRHLSTSTSPIDGAFLTFRRVTLLALCWYYTGITVALRWHYGGIMVEYGWNIHMDGI